MQDYDNFHSLLRKIGSDGKLYEQFKLIYNDLFGLSDYALPSDFPVDLFLTLHQYNRTIRVSPFK